LSEIGRIVFYPVDAYINFPGDGFIPGRKIESDDIRVKIVLQELLVDLQKVFVGAKYEVETNQLRLFPPKHIADEIFKLLSAFKRGPGI
jgi:hypothetical protein